MSAVIDLSKKRKRIQMVAPSGAVYSGTIHDEPMEDWGMPQ